MKPSHHVYSFLRVYITLMIVYPSEIRNYRPLCDQRCPYNFSFNTHESRERYAPAGFHQTPVKMNSDAFSEDALEKSLVKLARTPDFNLIDGFKLFDVNRTGVITPVDVEVGLKVNFDYIIDRAVINRFIQKYSSDQKSLKYSEFCIAFLPKDIDAAKALDKKTPSQTHSTFTPQVSPDLTLA